MVATPTDRKKLTQIFSRFDVATESRDITRFGGGHINETYHVTDGDSREFIMQRVNHHVFPRVPELMENIQRVTSHIERKRELGELMPGERSLHFLPSRDGLLYVRDDAGEFWRLYRFISPARTYDTCDSVARARDAASGFGRFLRYLSDLPGPALNTTIDRYHDGVFRFEQLDAAVGADARGRVREVEREIEFAFERRDFAGTLIHSLESGRIPRRAGHNDTKLNNLLFDHEHDRPICVIDLDTCMSGSALFDFGDMVRNTSVPALEDEQDFEKVQVDRALYSALVTGYLEGSGGALTPAEIELFPLAPRVFALTLAVRFLTDHIQGDTYFRIHHEGHNLERARTQFEIVRKMEAAETWMRDVVSDFGRD